MTESPASAASVFRVAQHVSCRSEGEQLLVYDIRRDLVYDGNPTALFVVERFDGQATLGEISRHLATEFGVPTAVALADVVDLAEEMSRLMLLQRLA